MAEDEERLQSYISVKSSIVEENKNLISGYANKQPLAPIPKPEDLLAQLGFTVKVFDGWVNKKPVPVLLAKVRSRRTGPKFNKEGWTTRDVFVNVVGALALDSLIKAAEEATGREFIAASSFRTHRIRVTGLGTPQAELRRRYLADQRLPKSERKKIPLALPAGHSLHQAGRAVDIGIDIPSTGFSEDPENNNLIRKYFKDNGTLFGWVNKTLNTSNEELWHYAYVQDPAFDADITNVIIKKHLDALRDIVLNPEGTYEKILAWTAYDEVSAQDRAARLAILPRRGHTRAAQEEKKKENNRERAKMSTITERQNKANTERKFTEMSASFLYNFETGLWGDGKAGGIPNI